MSDLFTALAAPFPPDAIHWRAQTLAGKGTSALALAYIDARDVMDRFDAVCGPAGWQNDYVETPRGRVIGKISVLVDGQWITKADGAGDTDVEGEKGGISDALKRTAVLWGVGRYLYRLPATWADCETYERNGKKQFRAWTPSGLAKLARVAGSTAQPVLTDADQDIMEITALAQVAGVLPKVICDTYGVANLNQLSADQRAAAKKRLNLSIDSTEAKKAA
jgi:hypothetical protein